MTRISIIAVALTAGAVVAASPLASATSTQSPLRSAPAQTTEAPLPGADMTGMAMCGERDEVVAELAQVFNEAPMAIGQVDGSAVVEIFASDSGSWTILATSTDGTSCIVSAGEGFESTTLVRGLDV